MFTKEAISKFWSLVDVKDVTECWPWTAGKASKGYGSVSLDGKKYKAHRAAKMIELGGPIPDGLHVCHHCDRPECCNFRHLFLGTNAENTADKVAKNRQSRTRGELAGNNKLTDAIVKQLLWERIGEATYSSLAVKYALDKKTVIMICNGESWPHIPGSDGAPTLAQLLSVPVEHRAGAKIDEETAIKIMKRLAAGEPGKAIARDTGLHFASISDIKVGNCWAHLAGVNGNPAIQEMQEAKPLSKFTAKMTEEMARDAKQRLRNGETAASIARSMGLSAGSIDAIKQGRTWAHLT